jgi:Type III flagellar switch regulator (C-ring) FliN C-term
LTIGYYGWLPNSALEHAGCRLKLQQAVAIWVEQWLGDNDRYDVSCQLAQRAIEIGVVDWSVMSCGVYYNAAGDNGAMLAMALLDAPSKSELRLPADHRLAMLLSQKAIQDLDKILAFEIGPGGMADHGRHGIDIIVALETSQTVLRLHVPFGTLAAMRKALCPEWGAVSLPSVSLSEVLAAEEVTFDVRIGSTTITAGELKDMASGDIIRLDREVGARFELVGIETNSPIGGTVLAELDGKMILRAAPNQGNY